MGRDEEEEERGGWRGRGRGFADFFDLVNAALLSESLPALSVPDWWPAVAARLQTTQQFESAAAAGGWALLRPQRLSVSADGGGGGAESFLRRLRADLRVSETAMSAVVGLLEVAQWQSMRELHARVASNGREGEGEGKGEGKREGKREGEGEGKGEGKSTALALLQALQKELLDDFAGRSFHFSAPQWKVKPRVAAADREAMLLWCCLLLQTATRLCLHSLPVAEPLAANSSSSAARNAVLSDLLQPLLVELSAAVKGVFGASDTTRASLTRARARSQWLSVLGSHVLGFVSALSSLTGARSDEGNSAVSSALPKVTTATVESEHPYAHGALKKESLSFPPDVTFLVVVRP